LYPDSMSGPNIVRDSRDWPEFLDLIIHDIGAPLRGVATSAELLTEVYGDVANEEAKQLVQRMLEGITRVDELLEGLANYSSALRFDSSTIAMVPCESVVQSALRTLEPQLTATGASVQCTPLPSVSGNWEQLSRVFCNLLSNAIQYRSSQPPRIMVSAERSGDAWLFAVKDNGIGIEPQYRDRIFAPFQRLHARPKAGAGLGLATCKRIVESHGGRIWVESDAGAGSTFFFKLPAEPGV
jgi:chemotaxis family two-component system sensor kinase Cph1